MGWPHKNTQHAIEREYTQLEYWQWGEIVVDPFAARAPHQLTDGAATNSLSSQYNNNTANLGCAGFPSMRLASRTSPWASTCSPR